MRKAYIGVVAGVSMTAGLYWVLRMQPAESPASTRVFTHAHSSFFQAVRHFFGIRPEPQQPIEYNHGLHIKVAGLTCEYCHEQVAKGPIARLPSVTLCMGCHEEVGTDKPSIQQLTAYFEKGQEPPWGRVYGWNEEAHVRFNHAPHIRAQVQCSACHGRVSEMTVAQRAVEHTMEFCVSCHSERKASIDCLTCHY